MSDDSHSGSLESEADIIVDDERILSQLSEDDSHSCSESEQTPAEPTVESQQDIARTVNQSPVCPVLDYPVTMFGTKPRAFSSKWYSKYSWLEYSVKLDAIFCYACRLFVPPSTDGRAEE